MHFKYNYKMGIKVGSTKIPDPSEWNYQVGDLDVSGERDATGLLHRKRVATKINYEFEWAALEWEMLQRVLNACKAAKFKLTAPDPRTFGEEYVGDYYVGDRTGSAHYYLDGREEIAMYSLKLKFIEF